MSNYENIPSPIFITIKDIDQDDGPTSWLIDDFVLLDNSYEPSIEGILYDITESRGNYRNTYYTEGQEGFLYLVKRDKILEAEDIDGNPIDIDILIAKARENGQDS
jgi:hypothetical protein